ncbi:MAG: zf-HC2 domain-containing protein [Anaerolineae bacterium]|jgi:anti-sigma factor RsiW
MASTLECPDEGQLRLFLDGTPPDRDRPGLEEHLKTCAGCRERLARLREDAALVSAALAASAPAVVDTARAWERFRAQAPTANRWPTRRIWDMFSARYRRMRRPVLGLIGVAAVLAAVILVPPLRTAAGQFLDIFRVERITVVTFDPDRAVGLDQRLFTRIVMDDPEPLPVAGVEEATRLARRPVLTPGYLPEGYELTKFVVMPERTARAWVDVDNVMALLEEAGLPTDLVPVDLDEISALIPPVVGQHYSNGELEFEIVQVASPEVAVPEGLDTERVAELGLQLLGFSAQEARGLAQNIDWATTLVVPIPRGMLSAQEVTVQGVQGYVLEEQESEEGPEALVVWNREGIVYAVAGDLPGADLLAVAQSLR